MNVAGLARQRPAEQSSTRARPRLRLGLLSLWLIYLLVLAAIVLVGAEAGLRMRRQWVASHLSVPPNPDPRFVADRALGYKNRPNYSYSSALRSGAVMHYTNNSLGLRGPEITLARPPGTYRVAIVGASTVYGALNDDSDTISVQLEAMLASDLGSNVEVVNAGVPSYEALREAVFTKSDVLALQPDVIVDLDGLNDVFFGTLDEWPVQIASDQIGILSDGRFPEVVGMIDRSMFPHGLLEHQLTNVARETRAYAYRALRQPSLAAPRVVDDRAVALHAASLALLVDYGRGQQASVVAALQPLLATGHKTLTADEQASVLRQGYWQGDWQQVAPEMYRRMLATTKPAVEAEGGTFVDLTGVFDQEVGTTYADDAVHYSPLGNTRLAAALLPLVEQRLRAAGAS
ncbi:MAG: SGNH/GDSL hydrolase family protein [Chloroflexi bacterium]|nr:SGNH/GDSL hydrolase family protein [Chloroflexota bacterium]